MERFRLVNPGEVDHEIDQAQLDRAPTPVWDAQTIATCESIYRRHVQPGLGAPIPDAEFCDLPRSVFLDYLAKHRDIVFTGSPKPNLTHLEPIVLSQNLVGWGKPRYVAFDSSIEAIYRAIVDSDLLSRLGHPCKSTLVLATGDSKGFYFGLDYRALGEGPWRAGTIYLFRGLDFLRDQPSTPFVSEYPVRPLAKFNVTPADWPLLAKVHGVDNDAQGMRQWDTFRGYPWSDDDHIHPGRWKRPLAEAVRDYLEAHFFEPVSLTDLGKVVDSSPSATLRLFRAAMGESPRQYLTRFRISKAKDLLKEGLPIAEVAIDTGFCDQTQLTRHFRQLLGLTPGQYLRTQESPRHTV